MNEKKQKPADYTFGRPTTYSPELATLVCERLASHPISMKRICKMYDDMPGDTTIMAWRAKHADFSRQYLAARERQAHILFDTSFDDIDEIKDYYYNDPKTGATCVDAGIVAAQKALANHKTFMASKIQPKHYNGHGDTTQKDETKSNEICERVDTLVKQNEKDF